MYLSVIRFLHIAEGEADPFKPTLLRLHYILQGIKRSEAQKQVEKRPRLPVSPSILRKLKHIWEEESSQPNRIMLWAACCLGFFGFLRMGEMTVPSQEAYDPAVHLNKGDVAVDDPAAPSIIKITIKQSKTDPFRKGINIFLGKTSSDLCPVAAILNYLLERGSQKRPFISAERREVSDKAASGHGNSWRT